MDKLFVHMAGGGEKSGMELRLYVWKQKPRGPTYSLVVGIGMGIAVGSIFPG